MAVAVFRIAQYRAYLLVLHVRFNFLKVVRKRFELVSTSWFEFQYSGTWLRN
jgi:hypothetical protein